MKRNTPVFITLLVIGLLAIGGCFIPFVITMLLFGPDIGSDKIYADPQNYIEFDGIIEEIDTSSGVAMYIRLNHEQELFYESFIIYDENYDIAVNNGAAEVLTEGAKIRIAATPAYLGDGWTYPVAYLCYDGTEFLPFEIGYKNIATHQKQASDKSISIIIPLGAVILFGIILLTIDLIIYIKAKPEKKETENASESKPVNDTAA